MGCRQYRGKRSQSGGGNLTLTCGNFSTWLMICNPWVHDDVEPRTPRRGTPIALRFADGRTYFGDSEPV